MSSQSPQLCSVVVLSYVLLQCGVMQCGVLQYGMLQRGVLQRGVLQCGCFVLRVAVWCRQSPQLYTHSQSRDFVRCIPTANSEK